MIINTHRGRTHLPVPAGEGHHRENGQQKEEMIQVSLHDGFVANSDMDFTMEKNDRARKIVKSPFERHSNDIRMPFK